MSLGTGAIQDWWGTAGRFHCNPVSGNQRWKGPPASTVTLIKGTSVEKLTWPETYHEPLPMGSGKGGALNWQSRREKQWSRKLNWASKLQIMVTKAVIGVQGSDPKDQRSRQLQLMATRAHVQAHGEASPCGHATDHRDRRAHSTEINLA